MAAGIGAAVALLVFGGLLPAQSGAKLEPGVRFHVGSHWVFQAMKAGAATGAMAGGTVGALLALWPPWYGWSDTLSALGGLPAIGVGVGMAWGLVIVGPLAGLAAAIVALKVARRTAPVSYDSLPPRLLRWVTGVLVILALSPAILAVCHEPLETLGIVAGFAFFVLLGVRWFAQPAIDEMVTVLNGPTDS